MRERMAIGVVILAVGLLAGLSWYFARIHNPEPGVSEGGEEEVAAGLLVKGRGVYEREGCASCHSIEGKGNPRNPLDGAGSRWGAEELAAWTTGSGVAEGMLEPAVVRRKQRYAGLEEGELAALVAYLASLQERGTKPAGR
jgi:mono/diheme cytochrome c family protein